MHRKIILVLSFSAFMGACTLDKLQEGELCPPPNSSQSKVYLFDNGETIELTGERCPDNRPQCTAFTSSDRLFGHYFCSAQCQGRQIPCDGICIELSNASDECKAANYKSTDHPDCPDDSPDCLQTSCTGNTCSGDFVMLCVNGTYQKAEKVCSYGCDEGACKPKPEEAVCTSGELRCEQDDLQICENNAWIIKEDCTDGCDAAAKKCKPAAVDCKEGSFQCSGKDLQQCVSGVWVKQETCSNGCDASSGSCSSAGNPGTNCTDGDKKCDGNFVTTCKSGVWKKDQSECTYGCASGECKPQSSTPVTGNDGSYCDGQVLHYKDADNKDATIDCASVDAQYGLECQQLKDGTSECVFAAGSQVASLCSAENEILTAMCDEVSVSQLVEAVICTKNSKNEMVAFIDMAISMCGISDGETGAAFCDTEDGTQYNAYFIGCNTCSNSSDLTAICDGKVVTMTTSYFQYDPDEIMTCDDASCQKPSGGSCSDECKSSGHNYCYFVIAESKFICSDKEREATGEIDMDVLIGYCGPAKYDETHTVDEYCATEQPGTIGVCDYDEDNEIYFECRETCTSVNTTKSGCLDDDIEAYEFKYVCTESKGKLYYAIDESTMSVCDDVCNAAGTACE